MEFFEVTDALELGFEPGGGKAGVEFVAKRLGVPGAGVDADASIGGEAAPEAPEEGAFAFFIGRVAKGECLHAARIEPAAEGVEQIARACAFDAGDDKEDLERSLLETNLKLDEFFPEQGGAGFVGFFGKPA